MRSKVLACLLAMLLAATTANAGGIDAGYVLDMDRNLPADPGEKSKTTVAGVDSNGNGVRDDVERWIAKAFPADPKARAASLQLAGVMQRVMAAGAAASLEAAVAFKQDIRTALECLLATTGDDVQEKVFGELAGVIVDTDLRSSLITQLEEKYPEPEGTTIEAPSASACAIQPHQFFQ